jgi:hypothetical protein
MPRRSRQQQPTPDWHRNQFGEPPMFVIGILQVPSGRFSLRLFILRLRELGLTVNIIDPYTATLYHRYLLLHPGRSQWIDISPRVVLIVGHSLDGFDKSLSESTDSSSGLGEFQPSPVWVGGNNSKNSSDPVYLGCGNAGEDKESSD